MATIRRIRPTRRFPYPRFRVVCKFDGRQYQYVGVYGDKNEAEQAKRDGETKLARGYVPNRADTRLGDYLSKLWLSAYDPGSQQRRRNVIGFLNAHILPSLGDRSLRELDQLSVLAKWKKGLVAEGYSASTIQHPGVVSMVFDRAVADHYIERDPMRMPGSLKRWPELRVAKTLTRPADLTSAQATKLWRSSLPHTGCSCC